MIARGGTAVVTGGTRGLGRALSLAFARREYRVLALYRSDRDAALDLERALADEGLVGRALRYDVGSPAAGSDPWSEPEIAEAERLVLVHNAAAGFTPRPFHLLSWNDFESALDVSLEGLWRCSLGLLRPMLGKGGGTIVSVLTSALGDAPPKGFAAYLAAKAAERALTRSLAAEYGGRGIRTLTVSPGFMDTPLTASWHPSLRQTIVGQSAVANPEEVARRIVGLVEDRDLPAVGEDYRV